MAGIRSLITRWRRAVPVAQERRIARDGSTYTRDQFEEYYGADSEEWKSAKKLPKSLDQLRIQRHNERRLKRANEKQAQKDTLVNDRESQEVVEEEEEEAVAEEAVEEEEEDATKEAVDEEEEEAEEEAVEEGEEVDVELKVASAPERPKDPSTEGTTQPPEEGTLDIALKARVDALFSQLDDDETGFITIGELRRGVREKLVYTGLGLDDASRDLKQTVRFFEMIDEDSSGRPAHMALSLSLSLSLTLSLTLSLSLTLTLTPILTPTCPNLNPERFWQARLRRVHQTMLYATTEGQG